MILDRLDKKEKYTLEGLSLSQLLMINDEICEKYPNTYRKSHTTKFFNGKNSSQVKSLNYNHHRGYWNATIASGRGAKTMKHFFGEEVRAFKGTQFIIV